MKKVLEFVRSLIKEHINENDVCIDMTLGNGNDTYFYVNYLDLFMVLMFKDKQLKILKNY